MKRIFTSGSMGTQVGSLLVYTGISGPAHPPKEKYSLKPVIVACVDLQAERTSHNNSFETEYFTLGGCAGHRPTC